MHPLLDTVDRDRLGDEAVALLRDLLRFDTSNPPGDEAACVAFLADRLRDAGLEPRVLESAPRRHNLVVRLPATVPATPDAVGGTGTAGGTGTGRPGTGPLLLAAHLDVVPAEADRWTHPPFAGEVADGQVWGRGAVDMKHFAAMSAVVVALLARSGVPRRRDVVLAAVADEETGCALGSRWLVDEHPDLVRAEHALGEVGGFTQHVAGRRVYPVQVAEKGTAWLRATASGTPGHGSVPREDNAVVRLAEFVARVGRTRLPPRPSPPVEAFLTALADALAEGRPAPTAAAVRRALPLLASPRASGRVSRAVARLVRDPSVRRTLEAVVRDTVTPTVLRAGVKVNVIPGGASADLDGRIAVGSGLEELLAGVRALAGPNITVEVLRAHPPTASSPDTPLFATLRRIVAEHDPGAVAVPTVISGFTDASAWSRLGTTCYGFAPVVLPAGGPAFADLFHADDERVPVDGLRRGTVMLADAVLSAVVPAGAGAGAAGRR